MYVYKHICRIEEERSLRIERNLTLARYIGAIDDILQHESHLFRISGHLSSEETTLQSTELRAKLLPKRTANGRQIA